MSVQVNRAEWLVSVLYCARLYGNTTVIRLQWSYVSWVTLQICIYHSLNHKKGGSYANAEVDFCCVTCISNVSLGTARACPRTHACWLHAPAPRIKVAARAMRLECAPPGCLCLGPVYQLWPLRGLLRWWLRHCSCWFLAQQTESSARYRTPAVSIQLSCKTRPASYAGALGDRMIILIILRSHGFGASEPFTHFLLLFPNTIQVTSVSMFLCVPCAPTTRLQSDGTELLVITCLIETSI